MPACMTSLLNPPAVPLVRNLRVSLPLLHPTAILGPSIGLSPLSTQFLPEPHGVLLALFRPLCWHQNRLFQMWLGSLPLLVCKPWVDSSPLYSHPCHSPLVPSTPQPSPWKGPLTMMRPLLTLSQPSGMSSPPPCTQESPPYLSLTSAPVISSGKQCLFALAHQIKRYIWVPSLSSIMTPLSPHGICLCKILSPPLHSDFLGTGVMPHLTLYLQCLNTRLSIYKASNKYLWGR